MKHLRGFLAALSAALAFVAIGLAPVQTSTAASTVVINSFSHATSGAPTSADADVQDWLDRVYADGGTVSGGTQTAVEAFVAEAKADGYWSTFRRLNLFAGTGSAWRHPLVNTSGAAADTASGAGITYAEATGAVTDGADYIDTGYTPTEATGGLSVYLRTTQASDTTIRVPIGANNGSNEYFRISANANASNGTSAGDVRGRWGDALVSTGDAGSFAVGMDSSMYHVSRASSTELRAYKDGATLGLLETSAATPATPGQAVYVFADNGNGTAARHLTATSSIGAYAIDTGMSDAQAALYYTDMQAFQTALGRQV